MNRELIDAVKALEKERSLEEGTLFIAIEEALVAAYKREFNARTTDNIRAEVDRDSGEMNVYLVREVVEEVEDPNSQVSLADAQAIDPEFIMGDLLEFQLSPQDFGRLAAQTAKSAISQRLIQAESELIQAEFASRIGELISGTIQRPDRGMMTVDIGRVEAVLPRREQVRTERYAQGQHLRFYILEVDDRHGRPVVKVSRSHPNLVRKLFEQEVPEVGAGIVEIVGVAREAGSRTKMSVRSHDPNVDATGACVGQRGIRVQAVTEELGAEKIDIIEWNEDPETYVKNALSPAKVIRVEFEVFLDEEDREQVLATVIVPDNQLSLAIGREGQNVRLAARLTGCKIDIKSEAQLREEMEHAFLEGFEGDLDDDFESEGDDDGFVPFSAEFLENFGKSTADAFDDEGELLEDAEQLLSDADEVAEEAEADAEFDSDEFDSVESDSVEDSETAE